MIIEKVKISNGQRMKKRQKQQMKQNHLTPQKYLNKQSVCRRVQKLQQKFGYQYDIGQNQQLRYLKQDFHNKVLGYYKNKQWTKKLGRKDKYQRNIQNQNPLKMNPVIKIFTKIDQKITLTAKSHGLEAIKQLIH